MEPDVTITMKQPKLPTNCDQKISIPMSHTNFNLDHIHQIQHQIQEKFLSSQSNVSEEAPAMFPLDNVHNSLLQLQLLAHTAWYPSLRNLMIQSLDGSQPEYSESQNILNSEQKLNMNVAESSTSKSSTMQNFHTVFSQVQDHRAKEELMNALRIYCQYFPTGREEQNQKPRSLMSANIQSSNDILVNNEQNEPIDLSFRRDSEEFIDVLGISSPNQVSKEDNKSTTDEENPTLSNERAGINEIMHSHFLSKLTTFSKIPNSKIPDMIPISDLNHNRLFAIAEECENNKILSPEKVTKESLLQLSQSRFPDLPGIKDNAAALQLTRSATYSGTESVSVSSPSMVECCMTVTQMLPSFSGKPSSEPEQIIAHRQQELQHGNY